MFGVHLNSRRSANLSIARIQTLFAAVVLTFSAQGWNPPGVAAAAPAQQTAASHWQAVGSMGSPRIFHTATLLQDGRVLVTGGGNGQHVMASAELYDPSTRQWSPTSSMSSPRALHTATLLADGRVLVVGGANDPQIYRSAELYDPASSTWSPAGGLPNPVAEQAAAMLPNGLVMIAGGTSDRQAGNQVATASAYNPDTNQWYAGAPLSAPRRGLALLTLADGRLLASGGFW